jgi:TolB protein
MSDRDGGPGIFDVYTMDADGSDPVRLTFNDRGDTVPAYAPDGKQIAFTSFRDGNAEIYRMRTDGSLQTLISNNLAIDAQPDWQPLKSRR